MASYLYILWDSWPISTSFHQLSAHLEMLVRSRKHTHPPTHIPWDSSNQLFKPWALARALPPTSQSWFRTGLDSGGHGPNWFTGLPLSIVKRYMLNNSGTVVARRFFFFLFQFFYAHSQPGTPHPHFQWYDVPCAEKFGWIPDIPDHRVPWATWDGGGWWWHNCQSVKLCKAWYIYIHIYPYT